MRIAPVNLNYKKPLIKPLNFTSTTIIFTMSYSKEFENLLKKELGEKRFSELIKKISSEKAFSGCYFDIVKTLPDKTKKNEDYSKIILYCTQETSKDNKTQPIEVLSYNMDFKNFNENDVANDIFNYFSDTKSRSNLAKEIEAKCQGSLKKKRKTK